MNKVITRVNILKLKNYSIYQQLLLEESIYRSKDAGNWVIINQGTPDPLVIVGIGGKPDKLVHLTKAKESNIPIMRRYTGGGTVIVDHNTLFTSFILQNQWLINRLNNSNNRQQPVKEQEEQEQLKREQNVLTLYPKDIMKWSETFYRNVFDDQDDFKLQEHDYAFGLHKFGGNAQAVSRLKFVHHTSFLFDYRKELMDVLKKPEKIPDYRQNRDHNSFLVKLIDRYPSMDSIAKKIENNIINLFTTTTTTMTTNIHKNNNNNNNNNINNDILDGSNTTIDGQEVIEIKYATLEDALKHFDKDVSISNQLLDVDHLINLEKNKLN